MLNRYVAMPSGKKGHNRVTSPALEKRTVLIVDDDADSREALAEFLQSYGYLSHEAENGRQALERLASAKSPPKLILLDLEMPIMDGREFLSRLRHHPEIGKP